ncbi:MAG: FkbM family methyltransferase [Candidatus Shapirobacteria bacterium]
MYTILINTIIDENQYRVELAAACRDCDGIKKVRNTGQVRQMGQSTVQVMFNGVLVPADGYCGSWMTDLIQHSHGHHEPQEEKVFYEIVQRLPVSCVSIIELGFYWAYYSAWLAKEKRNTTVICLEPDENNMNVGRKTFSVNHLSAHFVLGAIGKESKKRIAFTRSSDGKTVHIPLYTVSQLAKKFHLKTIDILHVDTQGEEENVLNSIDDLVKNNRIRFIVLSTHHHSISGSPLTHINCLDAIKTLGGHIIAEHSVYESFSGDGLIAASFFNQDKDFHVGISYARNCQTFFVPPEQEIAFLTNTIKSQKI